jgi:hypothetical protein
MSRSSATGRRGGRAQRPVTFDTVRKLALALPGVEEGTSYRTPALKVRGKLFVRLKEDGETIVLKADFELRDLLMQTDPETFYITDHYRNYPYVLVRLASVDAGALPGLLEQAWRAAAPKALVARFDAGR